MIQAPFDGLIFLVGLGHMMLLAFNLNIPIVTWLIFLIILLSHSLSMLHLWQHFLVDYMFGHLWGFPTWLLCSKTILKKGIGTMYVLRLRATINWTYWSISCMFAIFVNTHYSWFYSKGIKYIQDGHYWDLHQIFKLIYLDSYIWLWS